MPRLHEIAGSSVERTKEDVAFLSKLNDEFTQLIEVGEGDVERISEKILSSIRKDLSNFTDEDHKQDELLSKKETYEQLLHDAKVASKLADDAGVFNDIQETLVGIIHILDIEIENQKYEKEAATEEKRTQTPKLDNRQKEAESSQVQKEKPTKKTQGKSKSHTNKEKEEDVLKRPDMQEASKAMDNYMKETPVVKAEDISFNKFDDVEYFLLEQLSDEKLEITKKDGETLLEQIQTTLNNEVFAAEETKDIAATKALQSKILALQHKLDLNFVFAGIKDKASLDTGSELPKSKQKEEKIKLLKKLYAELYAALQELDKVLKKPDSKDVEKEDISSRVEIKNWNQLEDFLAHKLPTPEYQITETDDIEKIVSQVQNQLNRSFTSAKLRSSEDPKKESVHDFKDQMEDFAFDLDEEFKFLPVGGFGVPGTIRASKEIENQQNSAHKIALILQLHTIFNKIFDDINEYLADESTDAKGKAGTKTTQETRTKLKENSNSFEGVELHNFNDVGLFLTTKFEILDKEDMSISGDVRKNLVDKIAEILEAECAEAIKSEKDAEKLHKHIRKIEDVLDQKFGFKGDDEGQPSERTGRRLKGGKYKMARQLILDEVYRKFSTALKATFKIFNKETGDTKIKTKSQKVPTQQLEQKKGTSSAEEINLEEIKDINTLRDFIKNKLVAAEITDEEVLNDFKGIVGEILWTEEIEKARLVESGEDVDALKKYLVLVNAMKVEFADAFKFKGSGNGNRWLEKKPYENRMYQHIFLVDTYKIMNDLSKVIKDRITLGPVEKPKVVETQRKLYTPINIDELSVFMENDLELVPATNRDRLDFEEKISVLYVKLLAELTTSKDRLLEIKSRTLKEKIQIILAEIKSLKASKSQKGKALSTQALLFLKHVQEESENALRRIDNQGSGSETQNQDMSKNETEAEADVDTTSAEYKLGRIIKDNEDMVVSEAVKNDKEFNTWLEGIAEKNAETTGPVRSQGYEAAGIRTVGEWHAVYEGQKEHIAKIKELIMDKKEFEKLFDVFTTDEEKAFARQKMLDKLSWELITTPDATKKRIAHILETKEHTLRDGAQIKKLEKQKQDIEKAFLNPGLRMSGEVTYSALHGARAERVQMSDFAGFLSDMSEHYKYYHGSTQVEDTPRIRRDMFILYEKTRDKKSTSGNVGSIGFMQGILAKIKRATVYGLQNHDDLDAFSKNIQALQDAGLVATPTVDESKAKVAADDMIRLANNIQGRLARNETTSEALDELLEDQLINQHTYDKFKKVYATYIHSRGSHSSMQRKARKEGNKDHIMNSLDSEIAKVTTAQNKKRVDTEETLLSTNNRGFGAKSEYEEFIEHAESGFKLREITALSTELRKAKKPAAATLEKISQKLGTIQVENEAGEVGLAHRRISLELAQAYARVVGEKKEFNLSPSIAIYDKIFETGEAEMPKAKKQEYAKIMIEALKNTIPKRKNTLERLQLTRLLESFQKHEKELHLN